MNKKNFLYLINIILIFMLTGCAGSFNGIKKGVLMKDDIKSNLNNSENFKETKIMSEGQVKNIFIEGLKKYYGLDLKKKLDTGKLYVDFTDKQGIKNGAFTMGIDSYLKLLLDEGENIPQKGWYIVKFYVGNKYNMYNGSIDAQNGKIISLNWFPSNSVSKPKISDDDIKIISEKFIKDTKIKDVSKLQLLKLIGLGNEVTCFYKDKESGNLKLSVTIDTNIEKVIGFSTGIDVYIKESYSKDF